LLKRSGAQNINEFKEKILGSKEKQYKKKLRKTAKEKAQ